MRTVSFTRGNGGDAGLPAGWNKVESPEGVYYHNTATGESQWALPFDFTAEAVCPALAS